jgi:hypothetical protein
MHHNIEIQSRTLPKRLSSSRSWGKLKLQSPAVELTRGNSLWVSPAIMLKAGVLMPEYRNFQIKRLLVYNHKDVAVL